MSNYWNDRNLLEREALVDDEIKKAQKQLKYQYVRTEKEVEDYMYRLYDKIKREAGTEQALVSDLYKFNRYYDMVEKLNTELDALGSKEKVIFNSRLKNLYVQNSKLIGEQFGLGTEVNPDLVKEAIKTVWCSDGKKWSDRIWIHKKQLLQSLTNGMVDCLATGASHEKLVKTIMQDMGSGYNNANRLARTELSYIYNKSTFDKYEEAGIEQYIYLTGRDERTCEVCGALDGIKFNMKDMQVGVNYPPLHSNCRCTVLAVVK